MENTILEITDTNDSEGNQAVPPDSEENQVIPPEKEIANIWNVISDIKCQLKTLNSGQLKYVNIAQDTTAKTTCIQNTPVLDKTEEYLNRKMVSDKSDTNETEAKPSMGEKVFTQKSVTVFFKPIKDEEYDHMKETNVLRLRICRLEQGKKALARQVEQLKQQLSSLKSQNIDLNQRDKKRKPETGKSQSSVTNRKKYSSGNDSSNNNNNQPHKNHT